MPACRPQIDAALSGQHEPMFLFVGARGHVDQRILQNARGLLQHPVGRSAPRDRQPFDRPGNEAINPEPGFPPSPAARHDVEASRAVDHFLLSRMRWRQVNV
jgi:hypothetical protein